MMANMFVQQIVVLAMLAVVYADVIVVSIVEFIETVFYANYHVLCPIHEMALWVSSVRL